MAHITEQDTAYLNEIEGGDFSPERYNAIVAEVRSCEPCQDQVQKDCGPDVLLSILDPEGYLEQAAATPIPPDAQRVRDQGIQHLIAALNEKE